MGTDGNMGGGDGIRGLQPELTPDQLGSKSGVHSAYLDRAFLEVMRRVSILTAGLILVFVSVRAIRLPLHIAQPVITLNLVSVVILIGLYFALRQEWLKAQWSHALGGGVGLLLLANNLFSLYLTANPWCTIDTAIIIIAAGSLYFSRRWLAVIILVGVTGWIGVASAVIPSEDILRFALSLTGACTFALIAHVARTRIYNRLQIALDAARTEITERRRAEESLRESEFKYRELMDALPMTVFEMDLTGRVTFANRCAIKMFGYTQEDMDRGLNAMQFVAADDRARAAERISQVLKGEKLETVEYTAISKDGRTFPAIIHSKPVFRDNHPVGMRGFVTDVTEIKRAEEERLELADQLRHGQKMEAIGTLAGGVAHDFNNLLTGILGYASMLKMEAEPRSKVFKAADVIERAADRASQLTKQLLGFARKGKHRNVSVDLQVVIEEAIVLMRRTIDKNIEIVKKFEADDAWVLGDPDQFDQVILNLAINARDAMPDGGTLTFEAQVVEIGEEDSRALIQATPGSYLRVAVSDTGCGIPKDLHDRVFEPFFTTKSEGKGTGMGLAMVYGIVKNHGGFVRLYSEEGVGTRISAYLPLGQTTQQAISPPSRIGSLIKGRGRVLVVDDEEVVRKTAAAMLSELGYDVVTACDGVDAVEQFARIWNEIDLAIIDMIMPNMGGRDCFRALKEIDPNIRAVLSTGFGRDGAAQEILSEGMLGFVQKPYRINQLSEVVAGAVCGDDF